MNLRKFFIWAVSLILVVLVYLVYLRFTKTPTKIIQPQMESADVNEKIDTNKPAMIGNIGVEKVLKAKYPEFNKKRELVGEFGFDKLVHQAANQWELEKPYRNIYRPDFKCFITADKGFVKVEDVLGKPNFKDAVFSGNVVLHVVPQPGSDIAESNLYLDDIHFIGESSVFTTDGPIKFISENAQMFGRGLEAVYNEGSDRLEYFRIVDLNSMHVRTESKGSVLSKKNKKQKKETAVTSKTQPQISADSNNSAAQPDAKSDNKIYTCILSKNVVVETPDEVIFGDTVSISNIIMSGVHRKKDEGSQHIESKNVNPPVESYDFNQPVQVNMPQPQLPHAVKNMMDIYITCKGGIMMCLEDSILAQKKITDSNIVAEDLQKRVNDFNDPNQRTVLAAGKINFCMKTENVIADGPLKILFYPEDTANYGADGSLAPVIVTAQQKGLFLSKEKQAILDGNCVCRTSRAEPNYRQEYILRAPKLTIDLFRIGDASTLRMKHLTADGGIVQLANARKKGNEVLGFVKLKCNKFDYDPNQQVFLATGPGLIAIDNTKMPMSKNSGGDTSFNLRKPCYAMIEGFDSLNYLIDKNYIIASAKSSQINIGYMPVLEDPKRQQIVQVTAGHVEAAVASQKNDSKYNIKSLQATKGITYHDEKTVSDSEIQTHDFAGSELFYDANDEMITVQGSENNPCLLNGGVVKGIKYNTKTGTIRTKVVGPGILY